MDLIKVYRFYSTLKFMHKLMFSEVPCCNGTMTFSVFMLYEMVPYISLLQDIIHVLILDFELSYNLSIILSFIKPSSITTIHL